MMIICAGQAMAQAAGEYKPVSGPMNMEQTRGLTDFYISADWDRTLSDLINEGDVFSPMELDTPIYGFTESKIWLRLNIHNRTSNVDRWYLYAQENFLQNYDVYVRRENGDVEHIESHNELSLFTDRTINFPLLATQFNFAPDEKVSLYVSYWSGGSSTVTFTLETQESFNAAALNQTSKNFISYGMMATLSLTAGIAALILRRRVFLSYFAYIIITLLFLMHSDGVTFQHLWPNAQVFNSYFSIIVGLAFAMVPYDFARIFLRTKEYHPKIDKLMLGIMILTPVIIIPLAFIDPQMTKKLLMLLVMMSIFMGTFAGLVASVSRFREVRFYVLAWMLGLIAAALMNVRHMFGVDIRQNLELDSIRLFIIVDAIMVGLGVADRYLQNLKAQQKIDKERLMQAKTNLRLNNRLFALEEQYRLAVDLVKARDQDIKNTVHDIQQPIHALRSNLQFLEKNGSFDEGDVTDIHGAFEYLERLIADQLNHVVVAPASLKRADHRPVEYDEPVVISDILDSIHKMFLPDALEKGLDFKYVKTSLNADVNAFAVMRIVSNLVSNSVKYTPSGKILLGVRRQMDGLRIELHDTGPGMTEAEFERARASQVRLNAQDDQVEGHGFGLDIASNLARENGISLYLLEQRETGTSVALEIPYQQKAQK